METPIKVLMITSQWPTEQSPNDVPFLVRQVEFLRRAGVDVEVFSFRGAKNPLNYVRAWRLARQKLQQGHYDLVHAQFGQSALPALPKRLPLVITIRGDDVEGIVGSKGQYTLSGYILRILSRWVAKRADALIVVSSHMKQHFPSLPAHVVPSGLDLELFRIIPQHEARQRLGLPLSKRLVLFVGNPDDPRKRFALSQKAVGQMDRALNAELVVGWGVPHSDIPVFMNACDALVFTSMHEGSPNVVKEALACNLPVVSVAIADVPERLRGIEGCVVCADDRPETIASGLTQVLQRRVKVNSRIAVQDLDERILTQRLIEIYRDVARKAPAPNQTPATTFETMGSSRS